MDFISIIFIMFSGYYFKILRRCLISKNLNWNQTDQRRIQNF